MTRGGSFESDGRLAADFSFEKSGGGADPYSLLEDALFHVHGAVAVASLDEAGLLARAIPEIEAMRGCSQNEFHHKPVLAHTFEVLENLERLLKDPSEISREYADDVLAALSAAVSGVDARAVLRLSALLHDVEKPATRSPGKGGRITFHKHDTLGAKTAREITIRLPKLSPAADSVFALVKHHMLLGFIARETAPNPKSVGRFVRKLGALTPHEVLLSISDRLAARGPKVEPENVRLHFEGARAILKAYFEPEISAAPLITGAELMELAGIDEGPEVGKILKSLRAAEKAGEIKTKDEAREWLKKWMDAARGD